MATRVGTTAHNISGLRASSTIHGDWRLKIYGTVRDKNGVLAADRGVRVIRESDQVCLAYTESDANGAFEVILGESGPFTVVLSKETDRNALVFSGITLTAGA